MVKYKIILFDLDGTLSDPKEGITKSIQYALEKLNIFDADLDILDYFIGPPLQESFAKYYAMDDEQIQKAIRYYRDRFLEKGMYENILYPDIPNLLASLRKQGYKLIVATCKPTVFARAILEYFTIESYFELIVGSNLDGTRTSKTEIIQYILDQFQDYTLEEFVMIGDRKHDIIGANNVGIDSLAVTYGYGSMDEIVRAKPSGIITSVSELKEELIGTLSKNN